ncbi:glycosyltransferase family 4 protein [Demequina gelatinilytica]|uniref:glycosyltransferase family 4 protein n=1 Tax=Demequina gelatinilytica TaxID=1638980 RepID=UPI0007808871|nr:glycosyltransferase family 4 protein [Demequina gelatinilytica]
MSSELRILHTLRDHGPVGGLQILVRRTVEAQRRAGHDARVTALSGDPDLAPHEAPGFAPDVVHVHDSWTAPGLEGFRRVRTLHAFGHGCSAMDRYLGDGEPCERAHGPACVLQWARCGHTVRFDQLAQQYRAVSRELPTVRTADAVIVLSEFVRRTAIANGVAAERVHVVPPPAPTHPVDPSFDTAQPGLVTFLGRAVPAKGLDVLIEAIAHVPQARLRIVGDGHALGEARAHAARVAPDRVEVAGWVEGDARWAELSRASVIAMPNRWPEPFGLVGLEAAWAGRPIVATATGGVTEWLVDGVTGIGVPGGDVDALAGALARLVDSPEECARMGRAGRARVERWPGDDDYARALVDAYAAAVTP